jgi:hypothetical protein
MDEISPVVRTSVQDRGQQGQADVTGVDGVSPHSAQEPSKTRTSGRRRIRVSANQAVLARPPTVQ